MSTRTDTALQMALYALALGAWLLAPAALKAAAEEDIAVRTVVALPELRQRPVYASGSLASKREARLSFKTGGVVAELLVEEGQRVDAGQVLARLDPAEVDAALAQAEARLAKAQRDLERFEEIFQRQVISIEQLQNARTEFDLARAALDLAEFNRRHAVIRASAPGRVLRRLVETDELVAAGEPVLLLSSDSDGWIVRVWLADRDVVRVQIGDPADISLDALPQRPLRAAVSEIAAAANGHAGLFEVELALQDAPARLRSGFIARVVLTPSHDSPYYFLPMEAVVSADGAAAEVFVLDPQSRRVSRRQVAISHLVDGAVAVSAGVMAEEQVVSSGAAYLRDGMRVAPQQAGLERDGV